MRRLLVLAIVLATTAASADSIELVTRASARDEPRPIVGFRVRGKSKLTDRTLAYLAHLELGDRVANADIPRIQADLVSSELFEQVAVELEEAPGGVVVVATLDDKLSWIVAPTVFALPGKLAFGVGYAENNLWGMNKKLLLYGQVGNESLFFGTFLDPSVRGTKLTARYDLFAYSRINTEYSNPTDDPTSTAVARTSRANYLGGGLLVGRRLRWWLISDLRFRGGYVWYTDSESADDPPQSLPAPQPDGWDITVQWRMTLDQRRHRFGVTRGPYVQLMLDGSIPGIGDYQYQVALLRAYHSWRFFHEHQLELRTHINVGRKMPFNEELTLGGVGDLRGYAVDRFRGDTRLVYRTEYSVPITRWRFFAFRAIGFFDSGVSGWSFRRNRDRDYLDNQRGGTYWFRNNLGVGLRVYVKAVVLPLLGLDLAYGIEGRAPEVYFELGLTDF